MAGPGTGRQLTAVVLTFLASILAASHRQVMADSGRWRFPIADSLVCVCFRD
jgi:hypothetical protein